MANKGSGSITLVLAYLFKGQSSEILNLPFFHHSNLTGPLTDGLKYF